MVMIKFRLCRRESSAASGGQRVRGSLPDNFSLWILWNGTQW